MAGLLPVDDVPETAGQVVEVAAPADQPTRAVGRVEVIFSRPVNGRTTAWPNGPACAMCCASEDPLDERPQRVLAVTALVHRVNHPLPVEFPGASVPEASTQTAPPLTSRTTIPSAGMRTTRSSS